ncbi:MAG TPA: GNAT family N-acetyltransferase [Mycobacteriales bacterium]|nr:GNAT family N-acetyltransferase [Mycobacteriales bacterium]
MPYLVTPAIDPARIPVEQPVVAAGDLLLRPWRLRDAAQLVAAYSDPDIQRWHLRTLETTAEARQLVKQWHLGWRCNAAASWAVVPMDSPDDVRGQVGFRSLYLSDGLAEVTCWVLPDRRRSGLATTATAALAGWAVTVVGLERLELVHSVFNPASCRVALRAGFEFEGIKRRLQRHVDGWHDMCLHARIRESARPAPNGRRPAVPVRVEIAGRRRAL